MDQNEIARIAYELYLQRHGRPGDPVQDWLTAERIYAERLSQRLPATGPAGSPAQTTESPKETTPVKTVAPEKKATPRKTVRKKAAPGIEEPKTEKTTKKASAAKSTAIKSAEEPKVRKTTRKKTNS